MASKSKFLKLGAVSLIPGTQFSGVSQRNTVAGCTVVGDYMQDGQRVIVLERPQQDARAKAPAKRKTNAAPKSAPQPATAFPGVGDSHGA